VFTILAQSSGGGSSGNFLVAPSTGVMIWTLIAFLIALVLLRRLAFPRISEALDKRQRAIEESIDSAERTRQEADRLLSEYRERLREARAQADEIVSRAHQTAENQEQKAKEQAKETLEQARQRAERDIEQATQRALGQIRREVADLTIMATEKVTRKTLDDRDQKRLVEEALNDLDFSALSNAGQHG
jgi:F-type H+-transporting ATPase subunit b